MTNTKQDILKEKHLEDTNVLLHTNLNVTLNRNADCITHYTSDNIVSEIPIYHFKLLFFFKITFKTEIVTLRGTLHLKINF